MSFAQIQIVGNAGGNPEIKYLPNGDPVCNVSLAVNDKVKDKQTGEYVDETTWYRCTLWGKQAENCAKYVSKGDVVFMQGRLRIDTWTDRDQNTRFTLEVNVEKMQFLPNARDGQSRQEAPQQQQQQYTGQPQTSNVPAEFQ